MNSSSSPQRSGGATNQPLIGARQVSNSSNRNEEENVTTMSRAERFEDEKRRIIESCFSKKDSDGSSTFISVYCLFSTFRPLAS